jgi:hypothetical protein
MTNVASISETLEHVDWAVTVTAFNPKTGAFATYGNKSFLNMSYTVCLARVMRIAKAGRRHGQGTVCIAGQWGRTELQLLAVQRGLISVCHALLEKVNHSM